MRCQRFRSYLRHSGPPRRSFEPNLCFLVRCCDICNIHVSFLHVLNSFAPQRDVSYGIVYNLQHSCFFLALTPESMCQCGLFPRCIIYGFLSKIHAEHKLFMNKNCCFTIGSCELFDFFKRHRRESVTLDHRLYHTTTADPQQSRNNKSYLADGQSFEKSLLTFAILAKPPFASQTTGAHCSDTTVEMVLPAMSEPGLGRAPSFREARGVGWRDRVTRASTAIPTPPAHSSNETPFRPIPSEEPAPVEAVERWLFRQTI